LPDIPLFGEQVMAEFEELVKSQKVRFEHLCRCKVKFERMRVKTLSVVLSVLDEVQQIYQTFHGVDREMCSKYKDEF
jgi:LPS sulfotransferase NodH